jgi:hypothetical protein
MLSDPSRRFTRSRHARRTGLICLPSALAIELDAEHPEVPLRSIDEWLELPPEQRAPRAAFAMYEIARGQVRIAIIDAQAQVLHSMIESPKRALPRFTAAFAELAGAERSPEARALDRVDMAIAADDVQLFDIKPPGDDPGPGPQLAAMDDATAAAGDAELLDIKPPGDDPGPGPQLAEPITLVA